MADPLLELARDLRATGRPSLAWIVAHTQAPDDPVARFWPTCESDFALAYVAWSATLGGFGPARRLDDTNWYLLAHYHDRRDGGPAIELHAAIAGPDAEHDWDVAPDARWGPVLCAEIRRLVPVPPTLTELIEREERWRGR